MLPALTDIHKAYTVISPYAHKTPVLTSRSVNERAGTEVYFKCENFQRAGAFKFRGACNAVMTLGKKEAGKGVATHSSGNHAQALALAAKLEGIKAYIVMPEDSPKVKIAAVKGYGADITFCTPTLEARESTLQQVIEKTGANLIHPYNDFRIIAGQGTAALEFITRHRNLDIIAAPVGGGGLLSGTAIAAKALKPGIEVIGTEPENADDAFRSFKAGRLIQSGNKTTVADGLRTYLGELTFKAVSAFADDILTVSEEEIKAAQRFIWERMKIIIEPSSAVPVAAVFNYPERFKNRKTGIILSGGNVDFN